MIDNEIIKALECCKGKNCNTCPCFDEDIECGELLIGHTIDLINRLKAENEKLNIELKAMRGAANSHKAEVERLQSANSYQKGLIDRMYIGQKSLVDYAKSKAIKEFLRRIEKYFDEKEEDSCGDCGYPPVSFDEISDIAKEMTEVINENNSN